jgi:hypothetical protein
MPEKGEILKFGMTLREQVMINSILAGKNRNIELVDILNSNSDVLKSRNGILETLDGVRSALNHLADKTRQHFCPAYKGTLKKLRILKLLAYNNQIENIYSRPDPTFPIYIDPYRLGPCEREATFLYSQGLFVDEIAETLGKTRRTVNDQLYNSLDSTFYSANSYISPKPRHLNDQDSYTLLALAYMRNTAEIMIPQYNEFKELVYTTIPPLFTMDIDYRKDIYNTHLRDQIVNFE